MLYDIPDKTQDTDLPLSVKAFGIHHPQEPVDRQSGFPFYQWFYTAKGRGELIINQQRYLLTEHHGFLIHPHLAHSYHALTDDWTVHFVAFGGVLADAILQSLHMSESGVYEYAKPEIFLSHLSAMENLFQKKHLADPGFEYSKACYAFLTDLSKSIRYLNTHEATTENEHIKQTIRFMEEHYRESFSLDELADSVGLSKSYLCHLFKCKLNQSIVTYLHSIRIGHAKFLLSHYPDKKIAEVARLCGFEHPSYFGKMFRRMVGVTPDEFRKRIF